MAVIMLLAASIPLTGVPKAAAATPKTDFNGDGYSDLAIGAFNEVINGKYSAGLVNIIYGSATGLNASSIPSQRFFQDYSIAGDVSTNIRDVSEGYDRFGKAISAGDFNNDGYTDLAIGVPEEDLGSLVDAGAVNVIYGSTSGLSPNTPIQNQFWTQSSVGLKASHSRDLFGSALTTGDFNNDGYADLAMGVPYDDINGKSAAGSVTILYGSSAGLAKSPMQSQRLFADSPGILGVSEEGDQFGSALSVGDFNNDGYGDLAVGAPLKSGYRGAVNVIYGSSTGLLANGNQFWTQESPNLERSLDYAFGESMASGDFNADGFADLSIGVNNHVTTIFGSPSGLSATHLPDMLLQLCQNCNTGIGPVVASGDLDGDGYADLIAAEPDSMDGCIDCTPGELWVFRGKSTGISTSHSVYLTGALAYPQFGWALATGDYDSDGVSELAIGEPNWDSHGCPDDCFTPGRVEVWYDLVTQYPNGAVQSWTQDSPGVPDVAEESDAFGASLA
jgi:hypothetical protein